MPPEDNGTMPNDNGTATWHTLDKACAILKVSKRTLWRRIKQGVINSKLEDGKRLVQIIDADREVPTVDDVTATGTPIDTPEQQLAQAELIAQLKSEIEFLRSELQQANDRYEQSRQRQDTIIMTLTRQLGDLQLALEAHKKPWWRRLRLGKGKGENKQ